MVRWFATTVLLFPNIHNPKKHVHKLVCKPAKSLVQLNRRFNSSKTEKKSKINNIFSISFAYIKYILYICIVIKKQSR